MVIQGGAIVEMLGGYGAYPTELAIIISTGLCRFVVAITSVHGNGRVVRIGESPIRGGNHIAAFGVLAVTGVITAGRRRTGDGTAGHNLMATDGVVVRQRVPT